MKTEIYSSQWKTYESYEVKYNVLIITINTCCIGMLKRFIHRNSYQIHRVVYYIIK